MRVPKVPSQDSMGCWVMVDGCQYSCHPVKPRRRLGSGSLLCITYKLIRGAIRCSVFGAANISSSGNSNSHSSTSRRLAFSSSQVTNPDGNTNPDFQFLDSQKRSHISSFVFRLPSLVILSRRSPLGLLVDSGLFFTFTFTGKLHARERRVLLYCALGIQVAGHAHNGDSDTERCTACWLTG